jgi:hypothetical protein
MNIEQQVCGLELAKKLKELGVKQESFFCWMDGTTPPTLWRDEALKENYKGAYRFVYSAFTVAELGEMLPSERSTFRDQHSGKWKIYVHSVMSGLVSKVIQAEIEADARAEMLIHLVENKLITPP